MQLIFFPGFDVKNLEINLKERFPHADFSIFADAEFFACADFSAYLYSNFHHITDCFKIQILKGLEKIKIRNISNIKFSIMAGKVTDLMLTHVFHTEIVACCQQNRYVWFAIYTTYSL